MAQMKERAKITEVKAIGEMLVNGGYLAEQSRQIVRNIGIDVPKEVMDKALHDQARARIGASYADILKLEQAIPLDFANLQPDYGNGGVINAKLECPNKIDAMSALANMAQMTVLYASKGYYENARGAVESAGCLFDAIEKNDTDLLRSQGSFWLYTTTYVLKQGAERCGVAYELIGAYIENRLSDIRGHIITELMKDEVQGAEGVLCAKLGRVELGGSATKR